MTRAPAVAASSALPSVEPLSATTTSPGMPFAVSTARAETTHSSIVSASFRHGMTTETRSASPSSNSVAGAWVSVVDAMAGEASAVTSRKGPGR